MASETFGVKVNPEIKEKVISMISASGLNNKEWFESVVALYELQMYKHHDSSRKYLSDLEALQEHTSRINEIFSSLIKKIIDDNNYNTAEIEKIAFEKQVLIEDLEQQVQTRSRELIEVTRDLSEIRKSWKQLEELNYAQKETISHLQSELERQNVLISEFNQGEFEQLSNELRGVKQTLELTTLRHEKEVQELIAQHRQEIIEKYMSKSKISGEKKKGRPPKKDTQEQSSSIDVSPSQSSSNSIDLTKEQEE
ncbi:hypothetical protein CA600_21140 [Paenibacillus sp. VTT E-133280]|jgi:hypothetical protein|uniref:hypothetical protein n=1 Tax=Paenibacillus sp. VTT E-133280 TaxID=1986222 RepID=UPI000BA0EA83|nr:hypothetical protein [Paenibacillus sp. VTT E-133280]OZQ62771.1 hypothetical protein CA600_21140 [Paenibacillus sp. VTT E-133280]